MMSSGDQNRGSKGRRGRISQLRRRKQLGRNISRLLVHSLTWVGVAVLYYSLFSLFFDTPYEYSLKHSSDDLRREYESLEARYDSLYMVLESVEARDKSVFNMLFESSPYDFDMERDERLLGIYEITIDKSNTELRLELDRRCEQIAVRVDELGVSVQGMVKYIENQGDSLRNIPSIQPIANSGLTLLAASFGERIHPFYKSMHKHQGVDYTVPEGTRVFATADGVVKSYTLSSSVNGKSLVIDHGNGYETAYNHLDKIDLPRSYRVKRGDIIGLSGNTGLSLTPHLHYEVRYNGEPIDPIHYFFEELSPSEYRKIIKIAQSGMQSFD